MRLNKRQTFRMAQNRQPTILPLAIFNIYSLDFYQAFNYEVQSKLASPSRHIQVVIPDGYF